MCFVMCVYVRERFCNTYCTYIFCVIFVYFYCFVVILLFCVVTFVCTNVGLLPPAETPIAVSSSDFVL
jgi:hypothetical protein